MPNIYLSPSSQEFNPYTGGGNEEYYMNLIADAMEPYLVSSGIRYTRNSKGNAAADHIAESNRGAYDLHVALHSNSAPENLAGRLRGIDVYYYPGSVGGRRIAEIMAENLRLIYPLPNRVQVRSSANIGEIAKVKAPAVFLELGYHDNPQDAEWIRSNIGLIARNLVMSITEYFDIPFILPTTIRTGTVVTQGGNLNIRLRPTTSSPIIGKIPNGAEITVYSGYFDWYVIGYNGIIGYVYAPYVRVNA